QIEVRIYRSHSGNEEDYKLTPYSIAPQAFDDYLKTFYRDLVIKNMGDCHDMPRYENGYDRPFPRATYNFTRCQMNGKNLPEVLVPGFYKAVGMINAEPL
ncbi:hypothetical protein KR009_000761, partial [Drosophila setifemur]